MVKYTVITKFNSAGRRPPLPLVQCFHHYHGLHLIATTLTTDHRDLAHFLGTQAIMHVIWQSGRLRHQRQDVPPVLAGVTTATTDTIEVFDLAQTKRRFLN
ncbi:hypothetical protein B0H11DRAFT_1931165 [Mycena galericulata]|nr:hypothetical protein B0H11DRAFT_1931165 [Mycena galericulata]